MFFSLLPKITTLFTLSFVFASLFIPIVNLEAKKSVSRSSKSVSKKPINSKIVKTQTKTPINSTKPINSQNNTASNIQDTTNVPPYNPSSSIVKKSKNNICHDSNSRSYVQTKIFTAFSTLQSCLNSGGKLPLK